MLYKFFKFVKFPKEGGMQPTNLFSLKTLVILKIKILNIIEK